MKMISLLRAVKFGGKNFWRNGWLSLGTTFVMVLTLFIVSGLVILNILLGLAVDLVKEKVDISVYLKPEVKESQINEIKNSLQAMSEVKTVEFISKEEAMNTFREKYGGKPLIKSLITELDENPLQDSLIVKARHPEDYEVIADVLSGKQYSKLIDKVTFEDNKKLIERIDNASKTVKKFGTWIGLVFGGITVIFIFNTIRMTIYSQKEEIKIMKLVGATDYFIKLPFIFEGVLYGILAAIINTGILYFFSYYFSSKYNIAESLGINFSLYFTEHLFIIVFLQILFGVFLGTASSFLAIRRYLKI